jgi:hypothetical protein
LLAIDVRPELRFGAFVVYEAQPIPRRHKTPLVKGGHVMTTNQLDSMIAAAKQQLDDARRDGNPTHISRALAILDGRLDRKLNERVKA